MEKKIKLVAYCDSPTCATGFGTVSRNILEALYKTGKYEIDVLGINYWGDPHSLPYRIWPVGMNADNDPYGRKKVANMIPQMDFDVLFFLQDTFILDFLPELISHLKQNRQKPFKSIVYYPIDGTPKESWIRNVSVCDKIVAYTEFGANASKEAYPVIDNIDVIPHGVNTEDYKLLKDEETAAFRKQYFGDVSDKFIFMNLNRNQQRKDIPRTIQAFVEFRKQVPDSLLYLHMAEKDQGWNLSEVCKAYGLNTSSDVLFPRNFGPNQGYPRSVVNMLYNSVDCVLSTCLGEGFGLCLHPDTNVYTSCGIKKMRDLNVDDKVLSHDGTYNEIEGIMTRDYDDNILNILTHMSNIPLKSSPEHGFKVLDGNNYIWKKAKDLNIGDNLVFPKNNNFTGDDTLNVLDLVKSTLSIPLLSDLEEVGSSFKLNSKFKKIDRNVIPKVITIDKDLMHLFGVYLAVGDTSDKMDSVTLCFNKLDEDLITFTMKKFEEVFGLNGHLVLQPDIGEEHQKCKVTFYSSILAYFFRSLFGGKARDKYINTIILNQPDTNLVEFIKGKLIGEGYDGSFTAYEIIFSTVSKHIAYALRLILSKLSIISSVRTSGMDYVVTVSGSSRRKLLDLFNMTYPDVDESYAHESAFQNEAYLVLPIKDIFEESYKGKLVDIQVANTNNFVAENVVVHNSWVESMATKTPVIMPNNTAMTEFITEDLGYLADSGTNNSLWTVLPHDNEVRRPLVDVDDLVAKMLMVYNDRDEALRRAKNAYKWVRHDLEWQGSIGREWIRTFDNVVDSLATKSPIISSDTTINAEVF